MTNVAKIKEPAEQAPIPFTRKDMKTENDVRWCPGCGDYAILASIQKTMPTLGVAKEDLVFISGIGCSSRFPYYMNTYGMHSIHGRAPTFATGLKVSRPELSIWMVTGDGDGFSIGGNHMIHLLRRNVDINVLLFNNEIYGLTKGQYSPTSEVGKVAKSTPYGSVDHPVNPMAIAMGAEASFMARVADTDAALMTDIFQKAHEHKGTAFIEILQNCIVFNDGAFVQVSDKKQRNANQVLLEHGKPLIYDDGKKGIALNTDTMKPYIVDLEANPEKTSDLLVHDEKDATGMLCHVYAWMRHPEMPIPVGVFRALQRPSYDEAVNAQREAIIAKEGRGTLEELLNDGDVWDVD
ncbi:MAG: 2-oxoacid:ferredoxin oxidoreductase subunit beta [Myxococcales bacterium]|nr:2-oxoacid:ferredoxin oxidoreductase subunit beta [Myxococcales bacterium]|tara:strand:- start:1388 stop:2440 length:1053 start_codon:yes stop_codon:yes gene_type:complete